MSEWIRHLRSRIEMIDFFVNQTANATSGSQLITQPGLYQFSIYGTLDGATITPAFSPDNVNFINQPDPDNSSIAWAFTQAGKFDIRLSANTWVRVTLSGADTDTDVTVAFALCGA